MLMWEGLPNHVHVKVGKHEAAEIIATLAKIMSRGEGHISLTGEKKDWDGKRSRVIFVLEGVEVWADAVRQHKK